MKENKVPEALDILKEALIKDEGYFISWKANIAMAFQDEFRNNFNHKGLHKISNDAALVFMNRLFNYKFEELNKQKDEA